MRHAAMDEDTMQSVECLVQNPSKLRVVLLKLLSVAALALSSLFIVGWDGCVLQTEAAYQQCYTHAEQTLCSEHNELATGCSHIFRIISSQSLTEQYLHVSSLRYVCIYFHLTMRA
jgi:hypothetical protein